MMKQIGTSKIQARSVALGTWAIGGGPWWGKSNETSSIEAIHASIDKGISLIDTAPAYGLGRSEEVIGTAIKGIRDEVIIATKCGIWWHDDSGLPAFEVEGVKVQFSLEPKIIRQEVELSLKRLKTDYIDIYQTHWPIIGNVDYSIQDTMTCLQELKKEGKILAIGACNVSIEQIKKYQEIGNLDVVQVKYSMLDREAENELFIYCSNQSISTFAYSPLEQGLLTGEISMDDIFSKESARDGTPWFDQPNRQKVLNLLESWGDLAAKYQCSISELVIAWTAAQKNVDFVLCGSRNKNHALINAGALDLKLSTTDIKSMRDDVLLLGDPFTQ